MKKLDFLFGKLRRTSTEKLISKEKESVVSDIALALEAEKPVVNDGEKEEMILKSKVDEEDLYKDDKDETDEDSETEEKDGGYNGYYNKHDFEASLFNQILFDPVLRYALENGKWKFLHSMKYGEMANEYEIMKQEMINNGGDKFDFEGSLLQKISESYVYFRALEKLDTKFLDNLRNGTLLYNDYKRFAEDNNIDIIIGSLGSKKYHDFILSKNLS